MVSVKHTALIAALGLIIANGASAQTTNYDYSGELMGPGVPTTLDGILTLAAPLAPNLSNFSVIPAYAFFGIPNSQAGGLLIGPGPSYAGPGVGGNANAFTTLNFTTINFSTDSSGAITGWDLAMAGVPLSFESFTATSTQSGDSVDYAIFEPNNGGSTEHIDTANFSGGSWTSTLAAPEINPAGAVPALMLLAGIAAIIRGRRVERVRG